MAGFPEVRGGPMLDSLDVDAHLLIPVGSDDLGLSVDDAVFVVHLQAVAVSRED